MLRSGRTRLRTDNKPPRSVYIHQACFLLALVINRLILERIGHYAMKESVRIYYRAVLNAAILQQKIKKQP